MIDILIPMYGRGEKAQAIVDNIHAATEVEHRIVFLCSPDDVSGDCFATGEDTKVVSWSCGPADYSRKINDGLRITHHSFVFTGASDLEFTRGWDVEALKAAEGGAGVIGTNDDANPLVKRGKHSTHSLIRRSHAMTVGCTFFDGPGVIYSEAYKHQWVDTELVRCAIDTGQWAFARRSVVRHLHPFYHKQTPMDRSYEKALGDASHDSRLFKERVGRWTRERRAA
jgi:hypothetical protein